MLETDSNPIKFLKAKLTDLTKKVFEIKRKFELWRVKSENLVPFSRLKYYEGFVFEINPGVSDNKLGNISLKVTGVEANPSQRGEGLYTGAVTFTLEIISGVDNSLFLKAGKIFQIRFEADLYDGRVKRYKSVQEFRDTTGVQNTKVSFSEAKLNTLADEEAFYLHQHMSGHFRQPVVKD